MQRGSGGANVLPLLDLLLNVAPPTLMLGYIVFWLDQEQG